MRAGCRQEWLIVGLAVSRRSVTVTQPQTRVDAVAGW